MDQVYVARFLTSFQVLSTSNGGTAWYNNQDQAFTFQKQVRFEDGTGSPDLDPNLPSSQPPKVSTPYHGTSNLNHMFDIGQLSPFASATQQDTATIVAEISAAAVAQASKEFCHMCEPQITKLKRGVQQMQNQYFSCGMWIFSYTYRIMNWIKGLLSNSLRTKLRIVLIMG